MDQVSFRSEYGLWEGIRGLMCDEMSGSENSDELCYVDRSIGGCDGKGLQLHYLAQALNPTALVN